MLCLQNCHADKGQEDLNPKAKTTINYTTLFPAPNFILPRPPRPPAPNQEHCNVWIFITLPNRTKLTPKEPGGCCTRCLFPTPLPGSVFLLNKSQDQEEGCGSVLKGLSPQEGPPLTHLLNSRSHAWVQRWPRQGCCSKSWGLGGETHHERKLSVVTDLARGGHSFRFV